LNLENLIVLFVRLLWWLCLKFNLVVSGVPDTRTRSVGYPNFRVLYYPAQIRVTLSKTRTLNYPNNPTRNFRVTRMPRPSWKAVVAWRTGQSGAPPDTVRCASHVSRVLGFDRWSSDRWGLWAVRWCTG
jgi:hypothetical protein